MYFVFEPVAVAAEDVDLGVVDEPVDHGGRGERIAEDLGPGREGLVAVDDQRGAFVAGADEGKQQASGLGR